ncbi:MAG: hypothetical protein AB1631_23080, partial [Acidobacteriota bacterium]
MLELILLLVVGIFYIVRRVKLGKLIPQYYPSVSPEVFEVWHKAQMKSIDVILIAAWGLFVVRLGLFIAGFKIRFSEDMRIIFLIAALVSLGIVLLISELFEDRADRLAEEAGIEWPAGSQEGAARCGFGKRLIGIIFSPGEIFADLNRKPRWLIPMLIAMVISVGFAYFFEWRVKPNWDEIVRVQTRKIVERFNAPMPSEEDMQQSVAQQKAGFKYADAVKHVIKIFIASGIFVLGLILMSAQTTYRKILSVLFWSYTATLIVETLVKILALMVRDEESLKAVNPADPASYAATSLASVLPFEQSAGMRFFAAGI